jgi:nucleotide-binding universal stress UspA family protein
VSKDEEKLTIQRILVALDASPHSLAALETAAELAARFNAELVGLFVEDVNLLRLGELPFTQEVGLFSATRRQVDVREVERQLRAQARQVRRTFMVTVQQTEVRGTFRVARGAITAELLAAAADADMIILGKSGWSPVRRRLGSTARAVVFQAPSLTLVLQDGTCLKTPIVVIYGDSPLARKALAVAARLVENEEGGPLTVVILAEEAREAQQLQAQAARQLEPRGLRTHFVVMPASRVTQLRRLIQGDCGTLILPADSSLLRDEAVTVLLDEIEVPLLLVR